MSFNNLSFLVYVVIIVSVFLVVNFLVNKKYFTWIKLYWNYQRTNLSRVASYFYYASFILLAISLLDLRGPVERIKTSIPDQRTIIILDSSASMLAEDIKPNRFSKAIQLARHFVKNAPGHQIAIVLFSDVQKRLIPFTDDIDLLDSRLAALDKSNAISGGSNIAQAIKEALGYFQTQKEGEAAAGNILVFTDAEESEGGFNLSLGNEINLAVVGIGTAQGATIPLRWDDGTFRGYKTSNGENVITKLDEKYIKSMGKKVANYHYWIANSYSLPTNEIKDFFRTKFDQKNNQGDVSVRPVLGHLIIIPAIILFCISIALSRFKTFKTLMVLFTLLISMVGTEVSAREAKKKAKKKEKEIPSELVEDFQKLKMGQLNRVDVLKLAEGFLKNNDFDRANELYKDNIKPKDQIEVYFNMATSLMASGHVKEAMKIGKVVFESKADNEVKDLLRSNFLLVQQDKKGDGESEEKEKEDKEDKQDKEDEKKENEQEEKKDEKEKDEKEDKKENQKKDGKDSGESSDKEGQKGNEPKDQKDEPNKSDKPKAEPEDLKKPEREDAPPQTTEDKEKEIEKQRKMIKTPAMIKQILNDDRELQRKLMDTSTNEKGSSKGKRDW